MAEYIERTEELMLAMNAGARAIENTRRYHGAVYTKDVFSESPQEIPYLQAAKVLREVSDAPTVDAVPVTRCKDCKYYKSGKLLYPNKFCFRLKHPTENRAIGYNFGPDDFCSYGERKDVRETFFPEDVEA